MGVLTFLRSGPIVIAILLAFLGMTMSVIQVRCSIRSGRHVEVDVGDCSILCLLICWVERLLMTLHESKRLLDPLTLGYR